MRIHHLDGGTMRPFGGRLFDGRAGVFRRAELVCHCLLIEHDTGLTLVDTGIGENAVHDPDRWLGRGFVRLTRPVLDLTRTVARRIEALGYRRTDVRDIVLTHLDRDHSGGLAEFPHARVHVHAVELDSLRGAHGDREQSRYLAAQFAHGPAWERYCEHGEPWFGFDAVRNLTGLPPSILLIPLAGHSYGHTAVAVDTGRGWLLHAGDSYFHPAQVDPARPPVPIGAAMFEKQVEALTGARHTNHERLRELLHTHDGEVTVFSAHSSSEFHALHSGATLGSHA